MAAYALGDVVIISYEEASRAGEVVGVLDVADGPLYDVSLEEVVVKALPQREVRAAHADEVRSLLVALTSGSQQLTSVRQVLLRKRYIESLTTALERLEAEMEGIATVDSPFEMGSTVVICEQERWLLGIVRGVSRGSSGIRYDVEAMDELMRVERQALVGIEDVRLDDALSLGQRARMLVAGHETDDAYAGTLCAIERRDGRWLYSLMFDDGDILEELEADDVAGIR